MNKKILWLTRTAICIALLVVLQGVSAAALGNQFVTGSIVNFMLIVSVMSFGVASGVIVGMISPVVAFIAGIGATIPILIPFVILGNVTLVLIWYVIGNSSLANKYIMYIAALIVAAAGKFAVLFLGVTKLAVLIVPGIPAPVLAAFSFPQLITAGVGGVLAVAVLPVLKKALRS